MRTYYTVELCDPLEKTRWKPALEFGEKRTPIFNTLKEAREHGRGFTGRSYRSAPWLKYRVVVWKAEIAGYRDDLRSEK